MWFFFFVLFLDQSGEIGRVHLLASLLVEWQTDHSIMSTPGGVPGGLWAECSGYRTPPRSALLSVAVVPADAGSAGDVFLTHSDTSLCEPLHSAEAGDFTSRGFAVFAEGDGELRPAIDMGNTFRTGCWSPC